MTKIIKLKEAMERLQRVTTASESKNTLEDVIAHLGELEDGRDGYILHVSGSDSVDKVADEVIELVKTKKPYLGARGSVELTISKYRGPSKLIKLSE